MAKDRRSALVQAFLEMLAAERGAAANTLDAYRRDLSDYVGELARAPEDAAQPRDRRHPRLSRLLAAARPRALLGSAAPFGDPPVPPVSPRRRQPRRRPGADPRGAAAALRLPKILSRRGGDASARRRAGGNRRRSGRKVGERLRSARTACLLEFSMRPGCASPSSWLCRKRHGAAREPLIAVRGKGGRERLVPLSEPARRAMATYARALWSCAGRSSPGPGCFRRTATAAI